MINKKFLLGLSVFSPLAVFAEGDGGASSYTDVITQVQGTFTGALTALGGAVVAVVLAGVAVWLIPKVVGSLKTAFSSGKGR